MMLDSAVMVQFVDITLLGLLVITAMALVISRELIVSTILLSVFSLLMALMYMIMGAPDVAITEAAIGAGISTLLFLATILLVGEKEAPKPRSILPILVMVLTGVALGYATLGLPDYGDPHSPANQHLGQYYISQNEAMAGIPNVVTGILASYRGYDTMGEVFVVLTAGLAVLMLLERPKKQD